MPNGIDPKVGFSRAAIGQGLGMGWGDEAEAWLRSKLGQGSYPELLSQIRSQQAQYSKEYPLTAGAAELGGGILPGLALMAVPGGQVAGGSALARLAARPVVQGIGTGAATGAITGAGQATEGERGAGAMIGGTIGTALGAAIPVASRVGGGAKEWLMERLAPSQAQAKEKAAQRMTEAMVEAGIKPSDITAQMQKDIALGVPSTIANVNPALASLAENIAQRTGKGTSTVEDVLGSQQAGAKERVYQQLSGRLKPKDYFGEEDRLINELKSKAGPAYQKAYAVGQVDDPQIQAMLNIPHYKSAWNTARSIAEADYAAAKAKAIREGTEVDPKDFLLQKIYREDVDPNTGEKVLTSTGEIPDVRTLDYMKRAMDAQIRTGYKSDNAAVLANTKSMQDLRDALRDRTKDVVPEYAAALQSYKGDKEILDSLQNGYNAFKNMAPEQVTKLTSSMSDAEKDAFRTGVVRHIYDKIFTPARNINAGALLNSQTMQDKLKPLFDNPGEYNLFKAAVTRESQLFQQANKILAGSQTGKRTAMRERFEIGNETSDAVRDMITGGFMSSLTGMVNRALYKSTMTEEMADRLSKMLMSSDPRQVAATVNILENYAAKAGPKEARTKAMESGAITGATVSAQPPAIVREENIPDIEHDILKEPSYYTNANIEEDIAKEAAASMPDIEMDIKKEDNNLSRRKIPATIP